MKPMVYGICTRYWSGWRECVDSWYRTASTDYPWIIAPHMPIPKCFEAVYRGTTEPIISYIHDDVMIYEQDWDKRVLAQFDDPTVGVVGFGGALGHGTPNLYQVPYYLPNLARQHFLSNMRSWQLHGGRELGERDVAILDGMAIFVRRELLDAWGGWIHPGVSYFMYAENLCCHARRKGYRIRLVGVDFEHLGGRTVAIDGPHDDYAEAHRIFYESNKDVLPARVAK